MNCLGNDQNLWKFLYERQYSSKSGEQVHNYKGSFFREKTVERLLLVAKELSAHDTPPDNDDDLNGYGSDDLYG